MKQDGKLREQIAEYFLFIGFGLSGAAALIYEVAWTRSLSTIMGSSTYALSTMLAAFMAGLSVGGWFGAKLTQKIAGLKTAFALCELGTGVIGLITIPVIKALTPLYMKSFYAFHLSFNTFSFVQFVIAFMIMGIPTTLMGITFPVIIKLFSKEGRDVGVQSGRLYSINTFGAIIGSTVAGFLLIPALGVSGAAVSAASINIFTAVIILMLAKDVKKLVAAVVLVFASSGAYAVIERPFFPFFSYYNAFHFGSYEDAHALMEILDRTGTRKTIYHREGVNGEVSLISYAVHGSEEGLALVNNGKQEAGDEKGFALLAFLPYFMHSDNPVKALSIGLGSGHTLSYLSRFPFERIDSVELSEGIIEANRLFLRPDLFSDPRIRHVQADGRNYLLLNQDLYDVIVVSPSWAVESSSASMLTDEFFGLACNRLRRSGTMAVWIDFFMMTHEDLEMIMRTFSRHFAHATAWYVKGDFVILVGSNSPFPPLEEVVGRINGYYPAMRDNYNVVLAEEGFAGLPPGRINTDDRPVIEFHNARNIITWRSDES